MAERFYQAPNERLTTRSMMMRVRAKAGSVLVLLFVLWGSIAQAQNQSRTVPYYGEAFYRALASRALAHEELKNALRSILSSYHRAAPNNFDQIVQDCSGQGCYRHVAIGYDRARVFLMGYFYLVSTGNGYGVRDVYCQRVYTDRDFRGAKPGPQRIPDHRVVNVEHTWPQSRFNGRQPNQEQMSDLHHLFPTDSQMNSLRSSHPFGEVAVEGATACPESVLGRSSHGTVMFEPPDSHKGNVARALFYFAVRYGMSIPPEEEFYLRAWNQMDPVDQEEMTRNNEIYKAQGNRNPFIDHPDLANLIRDF